LHHDRNEDIRRLADLNSGEASLGNAHNGHFSVVDQHHAIQNTGVARKMLSPIAVSQSSNGMGTGRLIIFRSQEPPKRRPNSQRLEVVARDHFAGSAVRLSVIGKAHRELVPSDDAVKNGRILRNASVKRIREDFAIVAVAPDVPRLWTRRLQDDQLLWI